MRKYLIKHGVLINVIHTTALHGAIVLMMLWILLVGTRKKSHHDLGILQIDAEQLYTAYYEGTGGYKQRKGHQPHKVVEISQSVQRYANRYQSQMDECIAELEKKGWW